MKFNEFSEFWHFFCDSVGMSHVLPNISRGRFFEPIFTSKKFDLYTSIYGISIFGKQLILMSFSQFSIFIQ